MIEITIKEKNKVPRMPRIARELTQCVQCGYCIDVCEAHAMTPWESVTPRGKIYYLNQLDKAGFGIVDKALGRKVTVSPDFVDAMYKCTGCGNCEAVCHANIHLVEFWEKIRTWIVKNELGPMQAHKIMQGRIEETHNPYGEPNETKNEWWPKDVKAEEVPDVLFFAGCTASYRMQEIAFAGVTVLSRGGVSVGTMGADEWCCTSPLLRTGVTELSPEFYKHTVETADGTGAKDMVMTCAGCYKTVLKDSGKYYAKTGQNVYHFSQYIEELIAKRKLPLNNEFKVKATYHDPCHLGRHAGVYEPARNIIKKIKGMEFVEMYRSRELSRCCGAGGGYKSQYGDYAVNIAVDRIADAEEVGAELIITSCPFCVLNLRQGAKKAGSKIKVLDLSEVLLQVTAPKEEKKEDTCAEVAKPAVKKPAEVAKVETTPKEVAKVETTPKEVAKAVETPKEVAKAVETPKEVAKVETTPKEVAKAVETPKEVAKVETTPDVAKAAPAKRLPDWVKNETDEVYIDDYTDYTPEAVVRRAAWNNGLRCRRDYGDDRIPVAFVKGKVAVFVESADADKTLDNKLKAKGWTVLRYNEDDITDGEKQGEEIAEAVKENLKAAKKKKR